MTKIIGKNYDPTIRLQMKDKETLNVALGSINKNGLYSDLDIQRAHTMSNRELLQAVTFCLVRLMNYQNATYFDQHNELATIKAGKSVLDAFLSAGGAKTHINKRSFTSFDKDSRAAMDIPNPTRPNWS